VPPKHRGIELEQDLAFQQRSWRVQRFAWGVLVLIVGAALAGLAGSGPVSRGSRAAQDGRFIIEYERFVRMQAPSRLRLHVSREAVRAGEVRVWFDRNYIERIKLEQIVPQPKRTEVGEQRLTYIFAAEDDQSAMIIFDLQLQTFGRVSARVGMGEVALDFQQLVYP
jgi:hypothetical protein